MTAPTLHDWAGVWRNVTSLCDPAVIVDGKLFLFRSRSQVAWQFVGGPDTVEGKLLDVADEYQPENQPWVRPAVNINRSGRLLESTLNLGSATAWAATLNITGNGNTFDQQCSALLSYPCLRPLPTAWPGTPA